MKSRGSHRGRGERSSAQEQLGAHVLGPDLHHLLAPAPTASAPAGSTHCLGPRREDSHRGIPQPKPSSEVGAFPFLCLGQWKMLHQVCEATEHSLPDPYGPWEHTSLVMCSNQKRETQKSEKRKTCPVMNMHYHEAAFRAGRRSRLF